MTLLEKASALPRKDRSAKSYSKEELEVVIAAIKNEIPQNSACEVLKWAHGTFYARTIKAIRAGIAQGDIILELIEKK